MCKQVKYAGYYDPDPEIIEDKPSRLQLILGYPNGAWTSNCDNRWGYRMAQCPGVVPVPMGTYAEVGIKDQPYDNCPVGSRGGILRGPRPLDYGVATPYGWRHTASFAGQYTQFSAMTPQPGPYPRPMYRHGVSRPFGVNCDCGECRGKCGSTRIGACKGDGCTCGNCSSNCGCDDCGCGNDARFFDNRRHAGHQNRAARKADECGCCERGGGVQDGCAKKIPSPPKKKYPLK